MIELISKPDQLKTIILKKIKTGEYKPGGRLPSIKAICNTFNVSKHTVSQALSNLNELGAIDMAHGKVTRVSMAPFRKTIEIVYAGGCPIEQQEFWADVYRGAIDGINQTSGYSYTDRIIRDTHSNDELNSLDFKNIVGALVIGTSNPLVISRLKRYGTNFIMVYERLREKDISYVSIDYRNAMTEIIKRFVVNNRRRIAYIGAFSGETDAGINTDKYDCFIAALQEAGIKPDLQLHQNTYYRTIEDGYNAMQEILTNTRPDGIFVASDILALGIYRALYEAGINIPRDISIASCDNLMISKYLIPSLTTIELDRYKIGRLAAVNLIKSIELGNASEAIQIDIVPKTIFRESLK